LVKCATEICGIFATNLLLYKYYNNKEFAMAITETKVYSRSNVGTPFYSEYTSGVYHTSLKSRRTSIITNTISSTNTISEDGTTLTIVYTIPDLAAMSTNDTSLSIELDDDYHRYVASAGISFVSYTLSGISSAFTCTTVYTFPSAGLPVHDELATTIQGAASSAKLENLQVTDTVITAVHKYDNDQDFTATCWVDLSLVSALHAAGVTRTITYAMV